MIRFPYAISVASDYYVITLTTPFDLPKVSVLNSNYPNLHHAINKEKPGHGRVKRGYCSMRRDVKICYRKPMFYCSTCSIEDKKLYNCHRFVRKSSEMSTFFVENEHCLYLCPVHWCICLPSTLYFTCETRCCDCFLPVLLITLCSNNYVCYNWNFGLVLLLLTVWMNAMTPFSDSSSVMTTFMTITGF